MPRMLRNKKREMKAMKRILALFFMAICASAVAAPKADLWAKWEAHNPESAAAVLHDSWDMFLSRNVSQKDGIALVNYGAVSGDDKRLLDDYLQVLSQTEVSALNKKEQLAFWINFYNALTVKTVLDNYPVDSIKSISSGFLPTGPWDDKLAEVEGEEISLNDIEHRILRPLWRDARLHYAVNCASIGCPNLAARAFTAQNAEAMLDAAAADFINHPRGAEVRGGKLYVSSIYDWFAVDFGGDDAAIVAHLKQYAQGKLQEQLQAVNSIADDDYDWSLNDAAN